MFDDYVARAGSGESTMSRRQRPRCRASYQFATTDDCLHPRLLQSAAGWNVCDRLAISGSSTDSTFSIPATSLGLGYRVRRCRIWPILGRSGLRKDVFFTGRRLDAAEASAYRLVKPVSCRSASEAPTLCFTRIHDCNHHGCTWCDDSRAGLNSIRARSYEARADWIGGMSEAVAAVFESEDYARGRGLIGETRNTAIHGKHRIRNSGPLALSNN